MSVKINSRIAKVVGSATLAITARAKELRAQGVDVVNFAAGEPDFDTPEHIKQAAISAIKAGTTKYTPSIGTLDLRQVIAEKFKNDNNLNYDPSQIAVACGAKHSLYNVIQVLVDCGDEVLIPAPYWVSYPEMVKMAGGEPKFLETTAAAGFKVTPQQLAESITTKTKVLLLNSPSNPTGSVYSKEELSALAEICVKKQVIVISDEIYEKLIYDTKEYVSIASLGKEIYDLTITVNGVSKAYSMTGWRIGYSAGPKEIMGSVKKIQDHSTSNPCSISQAAAKAALQSPPESVAAMCDQFRKRRDLIMSEVDKVPLLSYIRPEGAFYLFCDFSKIGDSFEVAKKILDEASVALIPGQGFGAPGFVRMSFATSEERIQEGVKRIAQWIERSAA